MNLRVTTLNNGLRVITDRMAQLRTATVGVWVAAGARHETAANNGVAHMLEHMAFKGTERRNARAIAEEIEAVGGYLNAFTAREYTAYYARTMAEDIPLGFDIIADILRNSVFDAAEIERERTVIMQEIAQTNDTPDDIIFDHLQAVAYPEQAMGRSILGTVERVQNMTRQDLRGFMAAHYCAPGMVVVGTGALEHDRVVAMAAEAFEAASTAVPVAGEPARYASGEFRMTEDFEQAHLAISFPAMSFHDPDFYALQVYSTLLGGGMSSRLFQEVRENRGLAYSVYAFPVSFHDGGLFTIYAGTGGERLRELVPVLGAEMLKTRDGITEAELARARAQHKVGLFSALESSSARAEQLGRQMLIYGRPLDLDEMTARLEAVDIPAVQRVAARLLSGRPAVAALGPIETLESYDQLAARFI